MSPNRHCSFIAALALLFNACANPFETIPRERAEIAALSNVEPLENGSLLRVTVEFWDRRCDRNFQFHTAQRDSLLLVSVTRENEMPAYSGACADRGDYVRNQDLVFADLAPGRYRLRALQPSGIAPVEVVVEFPAVD